MIADHELSWIQILNDKGIEKTDVAKLYGVRSYPTKILIGKDGKIIKRLQGTGSAGGKMPKTEAPKTSGATASVSVGAGAATSSARESSSSSSASSGVSRSTGSSATSFKNMKAFPKGLKISTPATEKKESEAKKSRLEILLEEIFNK